MKEEEDWRGHGGDRRQCSNQRKRKKRREINNLKDIGKQTYGGRGRRKGEDRVGMEDVWCYQRKKTRTEGKRREKDMEDRGVAEEEEDKKT